MSHVMRHMLRRGREPKAVLDYTYDTRIEDGIMKKKLTITVSEDVYEGLYRVVGPRHIGGFLESLARPHVVFDDMDETYAAMAADEQRESQALEWAEGTSDDLSDRCGGEREAG